LEARPSRYLEADKRVTAEAIKSKRRQTGGGERIGKRKKPGEKLPSRQGKEGRIFGRRQSRASEGSPTKKSQETKLRNITMTRVRLKTS